MTHDDVIDLLKVLAAYDKRTVGEADVLVWSEQARRGRWTRDEAVEAVHEHHHRSPEFAKPAHVDQLVRAHRRDRLDRAPASGDTEDRALLERLRAFADSKAVDAPDRPRAIGPSCGYRRTAGDLAVEQAMRRGEQARTAHAQQVADARDEAS